MEAIFDTGPPEPCPTPFNMAAYVLAQTSRFPDKIALSIVGGADREDWTYGALKLAVLACATGFLQAGLTPGDRLLMRLGNSVNFPICYLAAISVGIVPVPTSAQLTAGEISVIANAVGPKMIVADIGIELPETSNCPVISTSALEDMRGLPAATVEMGDPNRPAYIIFTSGTGGKPRGVVHAHRAVWARRLMWQGWYGLNPQDRLLHAGALNWTYTLGTGLMDPWAMGATALIPDSSVVAADIPALLAAEKATIFAAAPGVFRQLLKAPMPPMPNLRHGLSAGEKMPDSTRNHWHQATGTKVHEAFGMSECSTFISASPDKPALPGTAGYVQPGRRVAIVSDNGTAKFDEAGIIAVDQNEAGLMLGYLDDPLKSKTQLKNGWFLTGDMASMSSDGAIAYLGRADDMMNAGGFRVSPLEVENAFRGCEGVTDCAAVEVIVKNDVSVIALFYQSAAPLDAAVLAAHASGHLARYKQPRKYHWIKTLLRGANGKLLRRELRKHETET